MDKDGKKDANGAHHADPSTHIRRYRFLTTSMSDRRVRTNTFLSRFVFLLPLLQVAVSSLLLDLRALPRNNNDPFESFITDAPSCHLASRFVFLFVARTSTYLPFCFFSRSSLPIRLF